MLQFIKTILPRQKGVYIIGGSIRDLLLGRVPADYDIACTGNPEKFAKKILAESVGHLVRLGKSDQMIFRVISGGTIFDITSLNGASIEEDLKKRDFTVNAVAYDLYSEKIIDCFGGLKDLADKKVRMVSKKIFKKDPVRLIRAYRIGACLNFEIESRTAELIAYHVKLLRNIAGERIRAELLSMLDTSASYPYLIQMANNGLLEAVFPGFDCLKGCVQNNHHHFDVFEHTLSAFEHLETMMNKPEDILPGISTQICRYIAKTRPALIKCAILIHDIGKPLTKTVDSSGKCRFYGHARKSAQMARTIGQRLRFSNREQRFIDCIVRHHMKPLSLFKAYEKKTATQKSIVRFYKKCDDNTPAVLLAAMADTKAKQYKMTSQSKDLISFIEKLIYDYFMSYQALRDTSPLITGHDLIHVLGLAPSPIFKKILEFVDDAKLTHTVKNRSEALELVRNYLASIHK
jgi:putative nucleotidyltransferase with HDIG domain